MPAVFQTVQVYSNYDRVIANYLSGLVYHRETEKPRTMLIVFATPERAFARVKEKVSDNKKKAQSVIPYPFVTIDRVSTLLDQDRFIQVKFRRELEGTNRKTNLLAYLGMQRPLPINITYEVSVWTRQLMDQDDTTNQLMLRFSPYNINYFFVPHELPMGERLVSLFYNGYDDATSNKEPGRDQRVLRRVHRLMVRGWLTYTPEVFGAIEKITVDIHETDEDLVEVGDLLDTITVDTDDV